jgi:hypothetical protein
VSNSKRNWAKFGVGVKLVVILRHTIAYFSINIRWHSQNVSSDSRKWLINHLFPPSSCKKQINKQNSYLLLAFLQSGSVPELNMHESKHFLPGQFVHSGVTLKQNIVSKEILDKNKSTLPYRFECILDKYYNEPYIALHMWQLVSVHIYIEQTFGYFCLIVFRVTMQHFYIRMHWVSEWLLF